MMDVSGIREVQARELAMKSAGRSVVGSRGVMLVAEQTQVSIFSVVMNLRVPAIAIIIKINTTVLAGAAAIWAVATVLRTRRRPQIVESIIGLVSVDVVNLIWRQFACHKEPSKTPGHVSSSLESNLSIASAGVNAARNIANLDIGADAGTLNPPKYTSVGIVRQIFADFCEIGGVVFSHACVLHLAEGKSSV